MAYRKFSADQLFDGYRFRDENSVLITDEKGIVEEIISLEEAGDDIKILPGILSPGFINCHCHLELSHLRGYIPEKTGLVDFVLNVVEQRHFPEDEILAAIEKAEDEMLANGIVAVGDICNNSMTVSQKSKGRIFYHNFIEASGFNPAIADQRFQRSVEVFQAFAGIYSIPVESNSIVPHAPYSVAQELWDKIIYFPGNHLISIHNQETPDEDEWFRTKTGGFADLYSKMKIETGFFQPTGKSSLQSFLPNFLPHQQLIMVHNVHTSEKDLVFAKNLRTGNPIYWCLCPNANMYISNRLPDIELLMKNNCEIVLGTDSLASNQQLSIMGEIQTIRMAFPQIAMGTILRWATSNGAKALQLQSLLGSFETGKQPGILLLNPGIENGAIQRLD